MSKKLARFAAEWGEGLSSAAESIRSHKLRSALTLLGVMVGVFSILLVMTTMRAMKQAIEGELAALGANTFQVQRWPAISFGGPEAMEKYGRRQRLTVTELRALTTRATFALNIGAQIDLTMAEASSRFDKTPPNTMLVGATPGAFPARNWVVKEGRTLTESDNDSAIDVCVLGSGLEKALFPFGSALGDSMKFEGIPYRVVGILESKGTMGGNDQDRFALIPLNTGLNRHGRPWRSLEVLVQAPDRASYDATLEQTRSILRAIRKVPPGAEDDFEIFSNDSLINQFESFTLTVRIGLAAVSSIALLAAGIGIMNIMLVSVTERTREIGIRRAVGARKRHIRTQFLLEAVLLCEVGGILGVIGGLLVGNIAAHVMHLPSVVPVDWILLSLGLCSLVGIVFGVYPARKAAALDPVESLRFE